MERLSVSQNTRKCYFVNSKYIYQHSRLPKSESVTKLLTEGSAVVCSSSAGSTSSSFDGSTSLLMSSLRSILKIWALNCKLIQTDNQLLQRWYSTQNVTVIQLRDTEARDDASFFTDCLQVTSASSTLTSNILLTMAQITQQLCLNLSQNHSNKLVIQPLSANTPGQPVTGSTEKPTTHCHHNQAGTHYYLPSHTASPPFGRHQLSYHIFIMPKQRNILDICTQHTCINT